MAAGRQGRPILSLQSIHSMLIYDDEDEDVEEDILRDDDAHTCLDADHTDRTVVADRVEKDGPVGATSRGSESELNVDRETNRRVTRSSIHLSNIDPTRRSRSVSVLDVPMLAQLPSLFKLVDSARMTLKGVTLSHGKGIDKAVLMDETASSVRTMLKQADMRCWSCLLPAMDRPLPREQWASFDSSSLAARCHFTPAEDDLLLRGLIVNLKNMAVSAAHPSNNNNNIETNDNKGKMDMMVN
jgi:hypothetical protein